MLSFLKGSQQIIHKAENSRSSKTNTLFRDMQKNTKNGTGLSQKSR